MNLTANENWVMMPPRISIVQRSLSPLGIGLRNQAVSSQEVIRLH